MKKLSLLLVCFLVCSVSFTFAEMDEQTTKMFEQAEKNITDQDYTKAINVLNQNLRRHCKRVVQPAPKEIQEKYDALMGKINEATTAQLKEAEGTLEKDPAKAIQMLQAIQSYSGTEAAKTAQAKLKELRKNKDTRAKFTEVQAQNTLTQAMAYLDDKKYEAALSSFKNISRRFANTEAGKTAAAKVEELEKNGECQKAIKEKNELATQNALASAYFNLANTLIRHNQKDEGIKFLKHVCENYKQAKVAKSADELLNKLTNPAPAKKDKPAK